MQKGIKSQSNSENKVNLNKLGTHDGFMFDNEQ